MIKYINSTSIYAAWMVRNQTFAIANNTLSYINNEFVNNLQKKNNYHIFGIGEYDTDYFAKNSLGVVCKDNITPAVLMNLIALVDMNTYLDIIKTFEESETKSNEIFQV